MPTIRVHAHSPDCLVGAQVFFTCTPTLRIRVHALQFAFMLLSLGVHSPASSIQLLYFPFCFFCLIIHHSILSPAMKRHANLLNPAFQTQLELRRVLGGPKFWKKETKRFAALCKEEQVKF